MMNQKKFSVVAIETINFEDPIYLFSFHNLSSEHITQYDEDVHYPPILLEKLNTSNAESYHYRIIEGLDRVKYFQNKQKTTIEAFIYENHSAISLFRKAILYSFTFRDLNLIEKAIILDKLLSNFNLDENEIIHSYLPMLKEQPGIKLFKSIIQLNHLTANIKKYIVQERLTLTLAKQFCQFPFQDQEIIYHYIDKLKLGVNKVKFFLETLIHTSKRDNIAVNHLLTSLQFFISDNSSQATQQKKWHDELAKLRFPNYQQHLNKVNDLIKSFKLAPNWKIIPAKNFEGEGFSIELYIRNKEEYTLALKKLDFILKSQELDELFKLL